MVIVIKEQGGRQFKLPIPYQICINLAVREAWFRMAINYGSGLTQTQKEKYQSYLESVDFGELRIALKSLSAGRGLTLVEVNSTDGTYVKITT